MPPDSLSAQIVTAIAVLVTAIATAYLWDRLRGRAWLLRPVAIFLCVASAALTGLVAVNREVEMFGTWSDLFGSAHPSAVKITSTSKTGSTIVSFTIPGQASHLTMDAYAYLPAGYDQQQLRGLSLPVVEVLDGYPGSPMSWLRRLRLQERLDVEIAAHRMPPTVVVLPYQTPDVRHDTECVDANGGYAADTFLTRDVRTAVTQRFRVRADAAGWGLIGYSTGGFCAANLALRHPDMFAAAASLSGYFEALTDHTTGDLYRGSATDRDLNSPLWRLQHLPVPSIAIYAAAARDDKFMYQQLRALVAVAKPPLRLTTATTPLGGHTMVAWVPMIAPAFDWLASWLAGPLGPSSAPA